LTLIQLDSLASVVAGRVKSVDLLILDDTHLDSIPLGEGWMWDEGPWWYAAQISALSVNDNTVDFIVSPGSVGEPIDITLSPETDYISVINNSITVNDTTGFQELKIERDWLQETNDFLITGNLMDTTSMDTLYRNIEDPTLFTGTVFREMLEAHNVHVGSMKKGNLPEDFRVVVSIDHLPFWSQ